jgi:hypothetical protein
MEHLILPKGTAKRTRRTVLNFSTIGWWWRRRKSIYIVILQTTSSTSFHSVPISGDDGCDFLLYVKTKAKSTRSTRVRTYRSCILDLWPEEEPVNLRYRMATILSTQFDERPFVVESSSSLLSCSRRLFEPFYPLKTILKVKHVS